ncbi:ammonia channel protein, partial [Stenotrophomonas sp. MH1]|nr:ammonia channel protein [Stenotrophomonas sp. MH1]
MRTEFFTGLKARFGGLCLSFMLAVMAVGMLPSHALAQQATPPQPEATQGAAPAVAAEATAEAAAEAAPSFDRGDVAWMLTATLLVLMMVVPGLALFYGGLVRAKNVLSVLSQVLVVFSLVLMLWVAYGY